MFINKLLSLVLLILFSPIFLLIGIIIFFDDGLPVIFTQKRVGFKNEYFSFYKFRTMKKDTPNIPTHLMKTNKNTFTKTGSFFRKLSIDELPQLFNILKGEMLFIGPRPALYNQEDLINYRTKKDIHLIKPGITGWAQVNGRDKISIKEKVKMDYYYYLNKSFKLDLIILYRTVINVSKSKNISY